MKKKIYIWIFIVLMIPIFNSCSSIEKVNITDEKKVEYTKEINKIENNIVENFKNQNKDYFDNIFFNGIKNNILKNNIKDLFGENITFIFSNEYEFLGEDSVKTIVAITYEIDTFYFLVTFKKIGDEFKIYDFIQL